MPRPSVLLLAIGLSAPMAIAAEIGKDTALKPTNVDNKPVKEPAKKPVKEDEKEDKDKGCWWEQREDEEEKVKECARDDKIMSLQPSAYSPDICIGHQKKGYCTGKYAGWMQKNCFTTCNGCCADLNKHCPRWAKEGYCKKGGARQEWMEKNCMRSCGVCCGDSDVECKIQHLARKMKAMGMKFKEAMMQAEKDKHRIMEKMAGEFREIKETMKSKLGWLADSLKECGCNVSRPELPEKFDGWTCGECRGLPSDGTSDGYLNCNHCVDSRKPNTDPQPAICNACMKKDANNGRPVWMCKQCKPDMGRPSGKPEGSTKPGRPEITRPTKQPTRQPAKPILSADQA